MCLQPQDKFDCNAAQPQGSLVSQGSFLFHPAKRQRQAIVLNDQDFFLCLI
jgi:hypothetical protein